MRGIIGLAGDLYPNVQLKKFVSGKFYAVAADGGARHFEVLGIKPDVVVGDMDSINKKVLEKYKKQDIDIIKFEKQKDFTDSEAAVEVALGKKCDSLILLGAFGKRADHVFANKMMSVSLAMKGIPVVLTDGKTYFYTVSKYNSPFEVSLKDTTPDEDVFSIVPAKTGYADLEISGLEYELKNFRMNFGSTIGVSNSPPVKNKKGIATINVKSGVVFFIHTQKD